MSYTARSVAPANRKASLQARSVTKRRWAHVICAFPARIAAQNGDLMRGPAASSACHRVTEIAGVPA